MQLTVTELAPDTTVLTLYGGLDVDTAPALRATLNRLLTRPRPHIVVDVAHLDFCDSMGLGALVKAHQRAAARGGWLRLANAAGFMSQLLTVIGLADHLAIYPGVDEAVRAA